LCARQERAEGGLEFAITELRSTALPHGGNSGFPWRRWWKRLPTLQPAEIHAALAYYHLNKDEIDGYLEEETALCKSLEKAPSAA